MNETYAAFHEFFELIEADTDELKLEVYRLRYQIFCEEQGYLDATRYPDKLETDDNDRHSFHVLLRHRSSDKYIGTVRLISPDPENLNKPFPIERYTHIDPNLLDINKLQRSYITEISRFSISSQFGRRRTRFDSADVNKRKNVSERRRFPNVCLALVVGIVHLCARHNIIHWLSIMDPTLNRLLSFFGSNLDPVGPLTDYHGMRRPYYTQLSKVFDRMYKKHREVWELVTNYGELWPEKLERRKKSRLSTNNPAQGILTSDRSIH